MADNNTPLLKVEHLHKEFPTGSGFMGGKFSKKVVSAVNDLSFEIRAGETFGLVGESGCGKSTTGRAIMHLDPPTSGKVYFEGRDISKMNKKELKAMRREMQFIFQDPYASLNPRMTVRDIIAEGLETRGNFSKAEKDERVCELLSLVGLRPEYRSRYPHEFSGGQRQRIGIARTLAVEPEFIVCDEPISALDVSIQAQVINLLMDIKKEMDLTILFIAHNLAVVKYFSDRIGVMHFGTMVELADADELYAHPVHPYTKSLLSAIPQPDPDREKDKQRLYYDPSMHDYSKEQPSFQEIRPGHFVYASDSEMEQYRKEL